MNEYETLKCEELYELYNSLYSHPPEIGHHGARPENQTRLSRALSWLLRSEECAEKKTDEQDEQDERFVFLWISFNAAYGDDPLKFSNASSESAQNEQDKFTEFLVKVVAKDNDHRLTKMIRTHKGVFRAIMADQFLLDSFWGAERDRENEWEKWLKCGKRQMRKALRDENLDADHAIEVLKLAFARIYMLRNQIVHGSATYRSDYNRTSLQRGNDILGLCIPEILRIMLAAIWEKPDMPDWGRVRYPPYLPTPDDITKGPPRRGGN